MSCIYLPAELQLMVLEEVVEQCGSRLRGFSEQLEEKERPIRTHHAWKDLVNCLLVCRSWNVALEQSILRNIPPHVLLEAAPEAIALRSLKNAVDRVKEGDTKHTQEATEFIIKFCRDNGNRMELTGAQAQRHQRSLYRLESEFFFNKGPLEAFLALATRRGFLSCMQLLVDNGVSAEFAWTGEERTVGALIKYRPITDAVKCGSLEGVKLLLKESISFGGHEMMSPLAFAAEQGRLDIMGELLRANVLDVVAMPMFGVLRWDLWQLAATRLHDGAEILILLSEFGFEFGAYFHFRDHPLFLAVRSGNLSVVRIILKRDEAVDSFKVLSANISLFDWADPCWTPEVVELMRAKGINVLSTGEAYNQDLLESPRKY